MVIFKEEADTTVNLNEVEDACHIVKRALVKVVGSGVQCQLDLWLTPHVQFQFDETTHENAFGVANLVIVSVDMQVLDNINNDEDDDTPAEACIFIQVANESKRSLEDMLNTAALEAYAAGYRRALADEAQAANDPANKPQ